jgi:hypothetical protein
VEAGRYAFRHTGLSCSRADPAGRYPAIVNHVDHYSRQSHRCSTGEPRVLGANAASAIRSIGMPTTFPVRQYFPHYLTRRAFSEM